MVALCFAWTCLERRLRTVHTVLVRLAKVAYGASKPLVGGQRAEGVGVVMPLGAFQCLC